MHWEGFEPPTSGFVDRSSVQLSYQCVCFIGTGYKPMSRGSVVLPSVRRGVLDSPASRLSAGCSASELTARLTSHFSTPHHARGESKWANVGSNHGPPARHAGALAAELQAQLTFFPVWNYVLLSTGKNSRPAKAGSLCVHLHAEVRREPFCRFVTDRARD